MIQAQSEVKKSYNASISMYFIADHDNLVPVSGGNVENVTVVLVKMFKKIINLQFCMILYVITLSTIVVVLYAVIITAGTSKMLLFLVHHSVRYIVIYCQPWKVEAGGLWKCEYKYRELLYLLAKLIRYHAMEYLLVLHGHWQTTFFVLCFMPAPPSSSESIICHV